MQKFHDMIATKIVVSPGASASGALTGAKIDATGYSRARFLFALGVPTSTGGNFGFNASIWNASTSGATFTAITSGSLAAITRGQTLSCIAAIDVAVNPSYPWLYMSGSANSTLNNFAVTCDLYKAVGLPPSTSNIQQVVSPN